MREYKSAFKSFDRNLEERNEKLEQLSTDTAIAKGKNEEREGEIDRLIDKSINMIRGATVAGLSSSLDDARIQYGKKAWWAEISFYASIVILLGLSALVASQIIPWPWSEGSRDTADLTLAGILGRVVLLVGPIWLTTFTARRYASLFQLEREYAFKAALAKAVEGFKQEAPEYAEAITAAIFMDLREKPEYERAKDRADRPEAENPFRDWVLEKIRNKLNKTAD